MITQQGIPMTYNSDNVIMFMDKLQVNKSFSKGEFDNPSIQSWYMEDPNKRHRGMMTLWGQQTVRKTGNNLLSELLQKKDVLEVNGWNGAFTYERPVYDLKGCYTTKDTSHQLNAGIDGGEFELVLNRSYSAGDHLTCDRQYGQTVMVVEKPVLQVAEGYSHTVILLDNDKSTWYDTSYLVKGRSYSKVGHSILGERGTNFTQIDMPEPVSVMKCEFRLGAFSGVETMITGMADSSSFAGGNARSNQYLDMIQEEFGGKDYAVMYDLIPDGKGGKMPDIKSAKLGATAEFLTMRECERVTSNRLMWSKAATVPNQSGQNVRINEGLWNQIRRGVIKTYPKPGGITKQLMKEVGEYVFRQNKNKKTEDRRLKLRCGKFAYQNILDLFSKEIAEYNQNLGSFLGSDRTIPNPVKGTDPMNLEYGLIRFTKCYLADIGWVEIEEDTSLNFIDGVDRFARGMHSSDYAHTAYSIVIWDVDSQEYSNNKELPKGATLMEGGSKGANIHLVKPEGEMVYWGTTSGKYNYKKSSDIQSSLKTISQEFWAFQVCDVHVDDYSKILMVELDQAARRGFN